MRQGKKKCEVQCITCLHPGTFLILERLARVDQQKKYELLVLHVLGIRASIRVH